MLRNALASVVTLAAAATLSGCFLTPEYAYIEGDDVQMEPVRGAEFRAATEYGDIYAISMQSAHDVSGWIAVAIDLTGEALDLLDDYPSTTEDDGWHLYGPYRPKGSEVSWLFRLDGDDRGSQFEVWVGDRDAKDIKAMDRLLGGRVELTKSRRAGALDLDFDVIESYGEALKVGPDRDRHYTGSVALTFERDLESQYKHVDIDYRDFTVTQEIPIHDYFAATRYQFHREADGSGEFHVDIASTFQALLWSGPEVEQMLIDMTWDRSGAGKAHGEMLQGRTGDLMLGDLTLDECFDERGAVLWRELSETYAEALPDYNLGDPASCAL